jgi:rhamnogalacturonyl hydrolase YesR
VVSYEYDGAVEKKITWQGSADNSAWARGQGWGLYGYTMMYRITKDQRYLDHAVRIADFVISHPNLPDDGIPYWDFDAPGIPDALRDSSAAAIISSALLELSGYVDEDLSQKFTELAERQIKSLCTPKYLAEPGSNENFILRHGVGNIPDNKEIDVPLTYADYYFVEAMLRYKKIKGL